MDVAGVGASGLLQGPLTAFFASRQCPGTAIRASTQWALHHARAQNRSAVVGGFHSPLEQSLLRLMLEAGSPVVLVLARPVETATLKREWQGALSTGRMAVVSLSAQTRRLTEQAALDRNEVAARLADRIVIGHASPAGALARQSARWLGAGMCVKPLDCADSPT